MSHTRGEAQLAISVPRALDQHEDKQTSLFPKSSFLIGLVFVFGVAFGMIGLPTIITDWQQYCGKSCFPDKVRCNIHSSITVRPRVIASVLMESTKERMSWVCCILAHHLHITVDTSTFTSTWRNKHTLFSVLLRFTS
jgi:hypothetical protein